jgi:hypothetical protein
MPSYSKPSAHFSLSTILLTTACFILTISFFLPDSANAQTEVTGAIEGIVTSSQNPNAPVADAAVQIINLDSEVQTATKTGADGRFVKTRLPPGRYKVVVKAQNFKVYESDKVQRVDITLTNKAVPVPISLEPLIVAAVTPTPSPTEPSQPRVTPSPTTSASPATAGGTAASFDAIAEDSDIRNEINTTDGRRGGGFREKEVSTLPLGGTTLVRSFDELALLLPGVAAPPQTQGSVAGPGIGAGVGSSGQFSVNGMRSRGNNFTVDGSDNNDEDIGVRRQGFLSLVPQPIESIQEYRVTTLLAPAQYGRNFGAQVNAVSKSGGNQFHGAIYGFFNSSQLNSRNAFDTANGNGTSNVTATTVFAGTTFTQPVLLNGNPLTVTNQSDGKDSFTLGQAGFVLGGPIKRDKAFFFVSYERQVLNATQEANFAVPTVSQRGIFNTGATGIFADCLNPIDPGFNITNCTPANSSHFFPEIGLPTALEGDAVFSLFPFPNNPNGVYGANTFTEILPASARGNVLSGKYDQNFNFWGKPQTYTARYNFTQDWREIPVTGGALFSTLKPRVRTQNFSTFLTSELSSKMNNVLRLSYGRTRLVFDEVRDPFLIPSQASPNEPFLLNARRLVNGTLNPFPIVSGNLVGFTGVPNTGSVPYVTSGTTESTIGRVGQINIAGFSLIGVDVNNFPQSRVNNTYQLADVLGYQISRHSLAFGADIRRVELNSDLPRNSRTLLTYNGAPEFDNDPNSPNIFTGNFVPGIDFAAAGAPSGAFLSLQKPGSSTIGLRYYELNFFGQDTWRIRPNLSINFGLRYEFNTTPRERNNLIERTFNDPLLNNPNVTGLNPFLAGRTQIFNPDRNNFEPRVSLAWSPNWFGREHSTVIRAGFGLFHDQILGAVVSQSRNVFPNSLTVNTGGFGGSLSFFNPARGGITTGGNFFPLVQPGTLNNLNPALAVALVLDCFAGNATGTCNGAFPNSLSITLPNLALKTPSAEQYSVTFEQQLSSNMLISAAYIGTRGHNLLRVSTPNLGPNNIILPFGVLAGFDVDGSLVPSFLGFVNPPGINFNTGTFDRPQPNAGPVFIYETTSGSHYDALQIQLHGRFRQGVQFQANYTFAKAEDDASDMFDLAGAPALPQNSISRAGEFGPSNFDVRHRFAYNLIYDFPKAGNRGSLYNAFFGGLQIASTGFFQTGQPFTVNSIFDVNLDGNLSDRLDSTQSIVITGNRRQPLAIASGTNLASLIAAPGEDGTVGRNSFRAGNVLNLDLSIVKNFTIKETKRIVFRLDIFNFIDRANFGIPVRFLEAPSFGQATDTVTPGRRMQFALKYVF